MHNLRRIPVTIIIGVKSKDGIVVGSDSQTTSLSSTAKAMDTDKIAIVPFVNGDVLLAQAGNASCCARALEIFRTHAEGVKIETSRTAADIAEVAIARINTHLRLYNQQCKTPDDVARLFRENDFSLLVACFYKGAPYIHVASLQDNGLAFEQKKDYAVTGCGANIAQMFLCDLPISSMDLDNLNGAVAFIIEKVKKHDWACGGMTHLAVLNSTGKASKASSKVMNKVVKACQEVEEEEKKSWQENMKRMIERIGSKYKKD